LHHPFAKVNIAVKRKSLKSASFIKENRCLYPKFPDPITVCFSTSVNTKSLPNSLTNADVKVVTSDERPGDGVDGETFLSCL
jgi:hypothetical protein